jgi:hypothetical protein
MNRDFAPAWRAMWGPVVCTAVLWVLAVVYVLALRADAMRLCALLWVPIVIDAALFCATSARVIRLDRAIRHNTKENAR